MALPDELLEEIFLRLLAAADLTRASAACVSFRRVITAHPFLRRFRTLHPPPLLGILCDDGLTTAQPPHPSAAAAAATFAYADFACPFLPPPPGRWRRHDVRDGRALFSPRLQRTGGDCKCRGLVTEFAVCDPLHGRYLMLPALPDHLADQVHRPDIKDCKPFLAPPADDEDSSFRDFRVMCLVRCRTKLVLFVFSTCAGRWLADPVTFDMVGRVTMADRYFAHGCFCWQIYYADNMLVLDTHRMEFSTVGLPPPPGPSMGRDMAIVEAGEGRFGMFTLSEQVKHGVLVNHLLYAIRRQDGNGENQWQPKLPISLPENYRYCIMGVAGGYLLLVGYPEDGWSIGDYFSLNLQTFQVEWFSQADAFVTIGDLYANLPLSLSLPTL